MPLVMFVAAILLNLWCARHCRYGHAGAYGWTEKEGGSSNKRPYEPNRRTLNTTGRGHTVMTGDAVIHSPGHPRRLGGAPLFSTYSVTYSAESQIQLDIPDQSKCGCSTWQANEFSQAI